MSYGPQTRNPWEHDESEDEDDDQPREWQCPCGDEHCRGYDDDPALIRLFGKFYAADCVMANHHPIVVEGREQDARHDRARGK